MGIEDCDVFLSFRGEVRNNFTCYLYDELKRQGYEPFMDRENIDIGDEIHGIIKKAIKHSKSSIIVFSENYASSKHCLTELVHILERNRTSKYFIIPVFYYVTASDVKYQLGKFGSALEHVKQRNSDDIVQVWRAALAEAGDILAQEINEKDPRTESKIIADIVTSFKQKFSEHYEKIQKTKDATKLNQYQPLPTTSYHLDIEEGSIEAAKTSTKLRSKYEEIVFGSWIKDWMINNPKFVIIIAIVVFILIIFTVVTFIQVQIASETADTVSSVFKTLPKNFLDFPKNFPDFPKTDSKSTRIFLPPGADPADFPKNIPNFPDTDSNSTWILVPPGVDPADFSKNFRIFLDTNSKSTWILVPPGTDSAEIFIGDTNKKT